MLQLEKDDRPPERRSQQYSHSAALCCRSVVEPDRKIDLYHGVSSTRSSIAQLESPDHSVHLTGVDCFSGTCRCTDTWIDS